MTIDTSTDARRRLEGSQIVKSSDRRSSQEEQTEEVKKGEEKEAVANEELGRW